MKDFQFDSHQQYMEWCETMVQAIYYARISSNDDAIKEVVSEIGAFLHVPEGSTLIAREKQGE